MRRRDLLKIAAVTPLSTGLLSGSPASAGTHTRPLEPFNSRPRPGDASWPSAADWAGLKTLVGGRLLKLESPFAGCDSRPSVACAEALQHMDNPFFLGDQPALTQTSGWIDAWISQPSAYAVAAESAADVVAAVNFARQHHLRLVVKGRGHSYQGTSSAPDSLLIWTRHMDQVISHTDFVASGCEATQPPQPAVTVGAGAMWIDAYHAVTTVGGRYVQGGGCTTVGVAGLVQSGGFGSFSKAFGTAAAGLLEAEIVTADGAVRIANACTHPDLFWGIKGGGGGSLGVLTRLTLRTRDLPSVFGGVSCSIKAPTPAAYKELIAEAMTFYKGSLFNPHWGEQMVFQTDNTLRVSMVFQGLDGHAAQAIWDPFLAWVRARAEYSFTKEFGQASLPAQRYWDAEFLSQHAPQYIVTDDRPDAPKHHMIWRGDKGQVGWTIDAYQSAWVPASLLEEDKRSRLVDAIFNATRHWEMSFHFNKGLAGAPSEEIDAVRHTATNPDVLGAFALAIIGADGPPAFSGMPNPKNDVSRARTGAAGVHKAMAELKRVCPNAGSYVSESDYFESDWQTSFWGKNHAVLAKVKRSYDPDGLFFVHHGVGSEMWSPDGFSRSRT